MGKMAAVGPYIDGRPFVWGVGDDEAAALALAAQHVRNVYERGAAVPLRVVPIGDEHAARYFAGDPAALDACVLGGELLLAGDASERGDGTDRTMAAALQALLHDGGVW